MTYELAQKLKEAGFPSMQCVSLCHDANVLPHSGRPDIFYPKGTICHHVNHFISPTLEELIEECQKIIGEDVICISNRFKGEYESKEYYWHAATYRHMMQPLMSEYGATPEIAVANLYLKLKEK